MSADYREPILFRCDLCGGAWDRNLYSSVEELRTQVAAHLWVVHAVNRVDAEDLLPMTPEQVAWVRSQRAVSSTEDQEQ